MVEVFDAVFHWRSREEQEDAAAKASDELRRRRAGVAHEVALVDDDEVPLGHGQPSEEGFAPRSRQRHDHDRVIVERGLKGLLEKFQLLVQLQPLRGPLKLLGPLALVLSPAPQGPLASRGPPEPPETSSVGSPNLRSSSSLHWPTSPAGTMTSTPLAKIASPQL